MNVLLIDVDSKIPNLALMKIASYHRARGDTVGFDVTDPDKVYASVVFQKNAHKVDGLHFFYPNAEIDIGGSGVDLTKTLPDEIEQCSPDYTIYPKNDMYLGFTTRGCIRRCYFCIVNKKEGKFRRLYDSPKEAMDHIIGNVGYNSVQFLDNNILADKSWFLALTSYLLENYPKMKIDFNQGLDVRLLDQEIADRLALLKPLTCWKFAFDDIKVKDDVLRGIEILQSAGIDTKNKVMFYCYCHDDAQVDDCVERCMILKDHHTTAYTMCNCSLSLSGRMRKLKRWTRPWIFWSVDFDEYK